MSQHCRCSIRFRTGSPKVPENNEEATFVGRNPFLFGRAAFVSTFVLCRLLGRFFNEHTHRVYRVFADKFVGFENLYVKIAKFDQKLKYDQPGQIGRRFPDGPTAARTFKPGGGIARPFEPRRLLTTKIIGVHERWPSVVTRSVSAYIPNSIWEAINREPISIEINSCMTFKYRKVDHRRVCLAQF